MNLIAAAVTAETIRVQAVFEVDGKLKFPGEKATERAAMAVKGTFRFRQLRLAPTQAEPSSARAIRRYDEARADIQIAEVNFQTQLPKSLAIIGVSASPKEVILFHPRQPLTRDQLDLLTLPADPLSLGGLLPGREVRVGDTWKLGEDAATRLFGLDEVQSVEVQSVLKSIDGDGAKMELAGTVDGATGGVATTIAVEAKYTFDLQQKRISWIAIRVKENRAVGHVAPGVEATSRLKMQIRPDDGTTTFDANLTAEATPTPERLRVAFNSASDRFQLTHDRRWNVVDDGPKGATLRLVDRGALLAHCNIFVYEAPEGGGPGIDTFKADVTKALGENFREIVSVDQGKTAVGYSVLRATAAGQVRDVEMQWRYHHLSSPGGDLLVAFSMEKSLVERVGAADAQLVDAIRLTGPTAVKPDPASSRR